MLKQPNFYGTMYIEISCLSTIPKVSDILFVRTKRNFTRTFIVRVFVSFLHSKLHSWYDKDDKYIDVVNEMYDDNVLDDDDIEELDLNKEKDDFER